MCMHRVVHHVDAQFNGGDRTRAARTHYQIETNEKNVRVFVDACDARRFKCERIRSS